ncbi:mitochondrial 54S ribosomal protein mL46 [Dipodascopsis tothii]|uniref:mitochondrial 54S ribosomal protein mL46 n=1 Tax=Dipodascopsis tothii TaxID=44089 RepID=UPI0034CF60C5
MAGTILSRPPIVTPELGAFEKAYYEYQAETEKRLMWTFPHWFYFPRGTLASRQFAEAQPKVTAESLKQQFPHETPDVLLGRDRRAKQEVVIPERDAEMESEESAILYRKIVPNSRETEADRKGDLTSLERRLDRTLYLLVKKDRADNAWKFPATDVNYTAKESILAATERCLEQYGGENMDTWVVSRVPAAVYKYKYRGGDFTDAKVFYMKSHIFAGQFVPQQGTDVVEHAWLTKEEIKERVHPEYWASLQCLLSGQ